MEVIQVMMTSGDGDGELVDTYVHYLREPWGKKKLSLEASRRLCMYVTRAPPSLRGAPVITFRLELVVLRPELLPLKQDVPEHTDDERDGE